MDCATCERIKTRDEGTAPLWDSVLRTASWDVVHCYDTSLLGWLVLVPRRHVISIDELTPTEARELGELLRFTSRFLKKEVGCLKTYVMQFAEHPQHPHVHFHVVPRAEDMPVELRGANVFRYLAVEDGQRVADAAMNGLAERLRAQHANGSEWDAGNDSDSPLPD